jgi:hypothetical protein
VDLPARIAEGVAALREGRPADAATALAPVLADPDLAAAADLADVRARVASLLAQALLDAGRPHEAEAPCREAIRLLRRLGDREGLDEVRALQDRVVKAIAHDREQAARREEQARIAATPLDALLAEVTSSTSRADVLLKKAHALVDAGRPDEAAPLADEALALAGDDVRAGVLARLAVARARPDRADEALVAAYRVAERAEEFNLVSLVAHAARLAGVRLPVEHGPHGPPEGG